MVLYPGWNWDAGLFVDGGKPEYPEENSEKVENHINLKSHLENSPKKARAPIG